jgi:hypothetical protein
MRLAFSYVRLIGSTPPLIYRSSIRLKKALNSSGASLMNVDTAVIAGIRLRVRF